MVDVETTIRAYLASVAAITGLTGERLYAGPHPPPSYAPGDGPAIVFAARGGGTGATKHIIVPSVQFQFFGGLTGDDPLSAIDSAWACALAAHAHLHDVQPPGPIKQILQESLGSLIQHPDTGWYAVYWPYRFWIGSP